jgi:branched-subunit amino acid aminotransferase/4-amino-4-deoxychorismate lyase
MELNGEPVRAEDIASLALYNYGSYTTMLVDNGRVRGLSLHLRRLQRGTELLFGMGIDEKLVRRLVHRMDTKSPAIVRVTIFCRDFDLAHPHNISKLDILVTTRPAPKSLPAVSLKPIQYQRDLAEYKTVSIGGALYRRRIAQLEGFDDALFINDAEEISEGPTWNIGFVKGGQVIFPTTPGLPGISAELLQKALQGSGMAVRTQTVQLQDVGDMDSAFILSAGSGMRQVKSIGEQILPNSDTLNKLSKLYEAIPYEEL